jgi:co-chaperonin GroES (HSP10)
VKFLPTKGRIIGVEDEASKKRLNGTFLALPSRFHSDAATTLLLTDIGEDVNLKRGSLIAVRQPKEGKRTVLLRPKTWGLDASEILCVRSTYEAEPGKWVEYWQPFGNRVLVRRLNREISRSSGLIIPESCDRVTQSPFSVVLELGTEYSGTIQRGDTIYAPWSMGLTEIGGAGNDYYLSVPAEEIEAVFGDINVADVEAQPRPERR